jgi:hypothetical protein
MQFITTLALLASSVAALQVNWYHDHNCGQYKDTTYFQGRGIHGNEVDGKPASAGSALFVTTNVSFCFSLSQ